MGLEKVKDEILDKGRQDAKAITDAAKQEARKISADAEKKAKECTKAAEKELKETLEAMERKEMLNAEMELRKEELSAKKEAVEEVFAAVRKSLQALDAKKREAFLKKLLGKADKEIDVGSIYCNSKDAKAVGQNEAKADIIGGLIAENHDGSIRVDYSYETMLDSIKEAHLQDIAGILFSQK